MPTWPRLFTPGGKPSARPGRRPGPGPGLWLGLVLLLIGGTGCRGPAPSPVAPLSPTPWPTPRAYRSPTPPRPLPTVTFPAATPAAATPTPIVHIVQEGDTFSGIALRYGVTVETLQKANPGLDPAALPVGAQVVVPQAGQALGLLATPTPQPVQVRGPWCFATATRAVCTLAVRNPGRAPLLSVQVLLEVNDPTWGADAPWQTTARPWVLFVPSQGEVPLAVPLPRALGPQAAVRAVVLQALPADAAESGVRPLEAQAQPPPASAAPPWPVAVTVADAEDDDLVGVLVAAYDAADRVVAVRYAEAPASAWAAGRTVWLYPLAQEPWQRVAVWAEAYP